MIRALVLALFGALLIGAAFAQVGQIPNWPPKAFVSTGGSGIAFVGATDVGNNGGTAGNFSTSYIGSGSANALVLCIVGSDTTDTLTGVTYNGVAATLAVKFQPSALRWVYQYYLLGPASGSNTLAVTQTGGNFIIVNAAEYSGVKQSLQPDASNTGSGAGSTTLTTAVTVATTNSWAVTCMHENGGGGVPVSNPAANATLRTHDAAFNNLGMYDSAGPLATGSKNVTTQMTSPQDMGNAVVSYKPL